MCVGGFSFRWVRVGVCVGGFSFNEWVPLTMLMRYAGDGACGKLTYVRCVVVFPGLVSGLFCKDGAVQRCRCDVETVNETFIAPALRAIEVLTGK